MATPAPTSSKPAWSGVASLPGVAAHDAEAFAWAWQLLPEQLALASTLTWRTALSASMQF
jgi:hypothetical protein